MTGPIPFPDFDPNVFQIGPIAIRWYALAYIVGLLAGWRYMVWLLRRAPKTMTAEDVGEFFTWAILGTILGGRLGYVFFYMPGYFLSHPHEILFVWQGGMSFHGGLIGVIISMYLFSRRRRLSFWGVADLVGAAAPVGLLLGRIANFINGELYGRATDVPWAFVFPGGGVAGRHPSQLYEAALEGLVLFIILFVAVRFFGIRRYPGMATGIFLIGYGCARGFVELFREPDAQIGFLYQGITMGQLLSLPLIAIGIWSAATALRRTAPTKT